MAETQARRRRAYQSDGSAALDINALPARHRSQTDLPEDSYRLKKRQLKVRARAGVSPFTLIGGALAAIMVTLVIFGYVRLYSVTTQAAELESRVSSLTSENAVLTSTYESSIDLNEIEQQAISELGMSQPNSNQTVYLNLSGAEDFAEIYKVRNDNIFASIWSVLKSGFHDIRSCFS